MADWTPPASDRDWTPPAGDRDTTKAGMNPVMAFLRNVQGAATFGLDDEFNAALKAATSSGGSFGDRYRTNVDAERAQKREAEANPWVAVPGQVVGGLVPGTGLMKGAQTVFQGAKGLLPAVSANMVQGGMQGAGDAPTMADVPKSATIGTAVGAVVPTAVRGAGVVFDRIKKAVSGTVEGDIAERAANAVGSKVKQFGEEYGNLRPSITSGFGLPTTGFAGGVGGSLIDDSIRPETGQSDPYTKGMKALEWGLAGAGLMKGAQVANRAIGAGQKVMRGGAPALGKGTGTGGGAGGTSTPPNDIPPSPTSPESTQPKGPTAPQGVDPVQAKKAAMNDSATPEGRAKTNSDSPLQQQPRDMGDLVMGSDNVMAPRGQETPWSTVTRALDSNIVPDAKAEALLRPLRGQAPVGAPQLPAPLTKPSSEMADDNPMKPLLMQWKQSMDQKKTPMGMVDEGSVSDDIWEQYQKKIGTKTVDDAFTEFNNAYNAGKNREAFHEIPQKYGFVDDDAMMEAWRASPSGKLYDENRTTLNNIGSIGRAFNLDPNEISSIADLTRQKDIIANLKSLPRSTLDNLNDEYHRLVSEGISTHVQPDPHAMLKAALGKP